MSREKKPCLPRTYELTALGHAVIEARRVLGLNIQTFTALVDVVPEGPMRQMVEMSKRSSEEALSMFVYREDV